MYTSLGMIVELRTILCVAKIHSKDLSTEFRGVLGKNRFWWFIAKHLFSMRRMASWVVIEAVCDDKTRVVLIV